MKRPSFRSEGPFPRARDFPVALPTLKGILVGGGAAALVVLGFVLGGRALVVLGLFGLLVLSFSLAASWWGALSKRCRVKVSPAFVAVGAPARAQVFLEGRLASRKARFIGSLELDTSRRGVFRDIGRGLGFAGPLGLATWRPQSAASSHGFPTTLVVHPEPKVPWRFSGAQDEDWFTNGGLRPYQAGDELRRINWKATMKRSRTMVLDTPRPKAATTTVLLDLRPESYGSFPEEGHLLEEAVSLAAGLSMPYPGQPPKRLLTTTGSDSGPLATGQRWRSVLSSLAQVRTARGSDPNALLRRHPVLRRSGRVLFVTTPRAGSQRLTKIPRLTTVLVGSPSVLVSPGRSSVPSAGPEEVLASSGVGATRFSAPGSDTGNPNSFRWVAFGGSLLAALVGVLAIGRLFSGMGWVLPLLLAAAVGQLGALRRWWQRMAGVLGVLILAVLVAAAWHVSLEDPLVFARVLSRLPQALAFAAVRAPTLAPLLTAATLGVGFVSVSSSWLATSAGGLWASLPGLGAVGFGSVEAGSHFSPLLSGALAGGMLAAILLFASQARTGGLQGHIKARHSSWYRGATLAAISGGFVLALLLAPIVGGPLVDIHGPPSGGAVSIDPTVSLVPDLTNVSGPVLFTVKSPVADYWRLTTLDVLTKDGFASSVPAFPLHPTTFGTKDVVETFHFDHLVSRWLPVGGIPVAGALPEGTTWEPWRSTLAVPTGEQAGPGVTYKVVARVGAPSLKALYAAKIPKNVSAVLTYVPREPKAVRALAERITSGLASPYGKALAIQDYLRTHETYDLHPAKVPGNPLVAFLFKTHEGYCQQFATAFAVLARIVGLPTRLAVGFTTGALGPNDTYQVGSDDVHTWPEVLLGNLGWVRFEPTPGRGAPQDASYTGIPPTQVGSKGPNSVAPIKVPQLAPLKVKSVAAPHVAAQSVRRVKASARSANPSLAEGLAAALLGFSLLGAFLVGLRKKKVGPLVPPSPVGPTSEVLSAWRRARRRVDRLLGPVGPAVTPREYARLASAVLEPEDEERLSVLAERVSEACYGPS